MSSCFLRQQNVKLIFETDIKESSISILFDDYSLGHAGLVMNFIDSLLENLKHLLHREQDCGESLNYLLEILEEKLIFLKSFFPFAASALRVSN